MFSNHQHRTLWLVWTITHAIGWPLSIGGLLLDGLALADSGVLPDIQAFLLRQFMLWSILGLIQGIGLIRTTTFSSWWLPFWIGWCALQWSAFWYLEIPRYTTIFKALPLSQPFSHWVDLRFVMAVVGIGIVQGLALWPWLHRSGRSGVKYWMLAHSSAALAFLVLFLLEDIALIAPVRAILLFILPGALYGSTVGFALVQVVKQTNDQQQFLSIN
jgi:hypothetical protein